MLLVWRLHSRLLPLLRLVLLLLLRFRLPNWIPCFIGRYFCFSATSWYESSGSVNENSVIFFCVSGILCAAGVRSLLSDSWSWSLAATLPIGMRRNAATISLTLSLFSILCTCWANGSILFGCGLVLQVAESLVFGAIRIAFCCGPVIRARFSPCGGSGFINNMPIWYNGYAVNLAYIRACRQPSFRLVPTFHWGFSIYLELTIHLHNRIYPFGRNKRQGLDPFIFSIKDSLHIHKRHGTFYYCDTTVILRLSLLVRLERWYGVKVIIWLG